jgi:FlaA1/EpsC-like NDP-sugar epimerase
MELLSIREKERLEEVMKYYRPKFVFHAAAYKHVPILEDFPLEVVKTNVIGTMNVAEAAMKACVKKFVMLSTDKAVNPTNLMGASKRIAEMYVQLNNGTTCTQFITTRFGNVLGSNGSVVPLFKKQIECGGPVTVTHPDITRYFMTIPEAANLVLEAAVMGYNGEILVFDMGKPVKILDLAMNMIKLSGLVPDKDVSIKFTGIRPGEKMYEELFQDSEDLIGTHHPKILKAKKSFVHETFTRQLEEMIALAEENNAEAIRFHLDHFISSGEMLSPSEYPVRVRMIKKHVTEVNADEKIA